MNSPKTQKNTPARQAAQAKYNSKPEQIAKRTQRNAARQAMIKAGKASVGDGKDIDHKKPIRSGGSNAPSNLRVRSQSANRSIPKTSGNKAKK